MTTHAEELTNIGQPMPPRAGGDPVLDCGHLIIGHRSAPGAIDYERNSQRAAPTCSDWSQWSDREIARRLEVGAKLVATVRADLTAASSSEKDTQRTYKTKHGTQAVMDTSKIGKASPPAGNDSAGQAPAEAARGSGEPPVGTPDPANPEHMTREQLDELACGSVSTIELLEREQAENAQLRAQLEAVCADDKAAEIRKWQAAAQVAQRRQDELQQNAKEYQDQAKWAMKQLRRIGKAVGESDPAKVAATVDMFVRHAKVPA